MERIADRLASDGFAMPFIALTEHETEEILSQYEATSLIAAKDPTLRALHTVLKPHLIWRWADTIAHYPGIVNVVSEVLGGDVLVWSMDVFKRSPEDLNRHAKMPESGDQVAPLGLDWHQDSLYLGLQPLDEVVRIWLALTPTSPENGTMRYLRGSHRHGTQRHVHPDDGSGFANRGPRAEIDVVADDVVPVCLRPGSFSMHDIRTVHDSGANHTSSPRIAVSVTYISGRVRASQATSAMPVRGCAGKIGFEREPRPKRDLAPEALDAFMRAIDQRIRHMRSEGVPDLTRLS